ncbi:hypothetical protein PT974_04029 [Cladobotryum mycophilum]|uniref:Uncharacterized protein n=1 Tax=Cladobotryum mycophilum TaxID=491253 RepID=A0ABR0SV32_9HYPO
MPRTGYDCTGLPDGARPSNQHPAEGDEDGGTGNEGDRTPRATTPENEGNVPNDQETMTPRAHHTGVNAVNGVHGVANFPMPYHQANFQYPLIHQNGYQVPSFPAPNFHGANFHGHGYPVHGYQQPWEYQPWGQQADWNGQYFHSPANGGFAGGQGQDQNHAHLYGTQGTYPVANPSYNAGYPAHMPPPPMTSAPVNAPQPNGLEDPFVANPAFPPPGPPIPNGFVPQAGNAQYNPATSGYGAPMPPPPPPPQSSELREWTNRVFASHGFPLVYQDPANSSLANEAPEAPNQPQPMLHPSPVPYPNSRQNSNMYNGGVFARRRRRHNERLRNRRGNGH